MKVPLIKATVTLGVCVGVSLLAFGCAANARRGEPSYRPMAIDTPQLKQGQRVFMNKCQSCHPGGEGGMGFALNNKPLPAGLIKLQVRKGLGAMPSFGPEQISDEELDALAAYVVALRGADERKP